MKVEVLNAINDVKTKGYDLSLTKIAKYVKLAKKEKSSELAYELSCLPDALKEIDKRQFVKKLAKNPNLSKSKMYHTRKDLAKVVYKAGEPKWVYTFANEFQMNINVKKFLKVILDKKDAYYAIEFDRDILTADLKKNESLRAKVFDLVYSTKNAELARYYLKETEYTDKQKLKMLSVIGRETKSKKTAEKKDVSQERV